MNHLNIFSPFYFNFFKTMYVLSKYFFFQIHQCTEMRFVSFHSGGFTTMAPIIIPPDSKLVKHTSVQCPVLYVHSMYLKITLILRKNRKNFVNFSVQFLFSFCKMGHSANCSVCLSAILLIIVVNYMFSVSSILH